jgi:hypothetical protein
VSVTTNTVPKSSRLSCVVLVLCHDFSPGQGNRLVTLVTFVGLGLKVPIKSETSLILVPAY